MFYLKFCINFENIYLFLSYSMLENPWWSRLKMLAILLGLLMIGLLPMVDNFSILFGFISGFLLTIILFPNVKMQCKCPRQRDGCDGKCTRKYLILVSLILWWSIIITLFVLFYLNLIDDCSVCKYFSCPWGPDVCFEMDFNVTRLSEF